MNKQPEALRLANLLTGDAYWSPMLGEQAAEELRRLHAMNQELLEALQKLSIFTQEVHNHWDNDRDMKVGKCLLALSGLLPGYDKRVDEIRAVIAKAQGEQA